MQKAIVQAIYKMVEEKVGIAKIRSWQSDAFIRVRDLGGALYPQIAELISAGEVGTYTNAKGVKWCVFYDLYSPWYKEIKESIKRGENPVLKTKYRSEAYEDGTYFGVMEAPPSLEEVQAVVESHDMKCEIDDEYALIEFWASDGQDVPVEFNFDGTSEDFIKEVKDAADIYDVEEEVIILLNAKLSGATGIPDTQTLLDSCKEVEERLTALSSALQRL